MLQVGATEINQPNPTNQDRKMSHELQKIPGKNCVQDFGNHILGRLVRRWDDLLEWILQR
jgi:hypothetical protein